MSDRNALVTHNVTGESQYPVPSRPYPTLPALYIDRGDFSTTSTSNATRERFWRSVTVTPGCWLWTGHLTPKGYGRFHDGRRLVMVHRFSYELVEEIPEGLELGHLCHVRNCVNPDHLQPMTHVENVAMGLRRRGRTTPLTGSERNRRWRERQAEARRIAELDSGWWVQI